MKVVHMTSVHPSDDKRIFQKMCRSLVHSGIETSIVFSSSQGDVEEILDGVKLIGVNCASTSKLGRVLFSTWGVFKKTLELKPDIVHFHDPELIPLGLLLKLMKKNVIYDVHEHFPEYALEANYIPVGLRWLVSKIVRMFELIGLKFFDGIVAATPSIALALESPRTVIVQNFPVVEIFDAPRNDLSDNLCSNHLIYLGSISEARGVFEMLEAVNLVARRYTIKLVLAGTFFPKELFESVKERPGFIYTAFLGWIPISEVLKVMDNALAGLVLFHPGPTHTNSQPTKLFEYMAAGLPVIASNFPLWKQIVSKTGCGLNVDPQNPSEIAQAIEWLIENPKDAALMGQRGKKAMLERYNWGVEFVKLLQLYQTVVNKASVKAIIAIATFYIILDRHSMIFNLPFQSL